MAAQMVTFIPKEYAGNICERRVFLLFLYYLGKNAFEKDFFSLNLSENVRQDLKLRNSRPVKIAGLGQLDGFRFTGCACPVRSPVKKMESHFIGILKIA